MVISYIPAGAKRIVATNAGAPEQLLPTGKKDHDVEAMVRRCHFVLVLNPLIQPPQAQQIAAAPPIPVAWQSSADARRELAYWWGMREAGATNADENARVKKRVLEQMGA